MLKWLWRTLVALPLIVLGCFFLLAFALMAWGFWMVVENGS